MRPRPFNTVDAWLIGCSAPCARHGNDVCVATRNFSGRGILLGSDNTEVQYMDVDWARANNNDWHDSINTLVRK